MNHELFDLQWLARRDKDLPLPRIKFVENYSGMGGCMSAYWGPRLVTPEWWIREREKAGQWEYLELDRRRMVWFDDGSLVSSARGLIVVDLACVQEDDIAACIAHEWRHHWQTWNCPGQIVPADYDKTLDHDTAIINYFRNSRREADALRFELARAPDDLNCRRASLLGWPFPQRIYSVPGESVADWFSSYNFIIRGFGERLSWV